MKRLPKILAFVGLLPAVGTIYLAQVSKPTLDQGLLDQAVSFFNGGSRCAAEIRLSPFAGNTAMGPAVVCYTFSLELYLKLLHVLARGKSIKGHELNKLYKALPNQTKAALLAECSDIDLVQELTSAADAFRQWRYRHEHERLAINPSMLAEIVSRCHRLVHKLKPGLEVFGDNTHVQQCP